MMMMRNKIVSNNVMTIFVSKQVRNEDNENYANFYIKVVVVACIDFARIETIDHNDGYGKEF
jgi:hypothetical protein